MERKPENLWLTEEQIGKAWQLGLLLIAGGLIMQAAIWYGLGDGLSDMLMAFWNLIGFGIAAVWNLIASIAAPLWILLTKGVVLLGKVAGFILMFGSLALIPVGIALVGVWWHHNREPEPSIGGN